MEAIKNKIKLYSSVVCYAFSIALYIFDVLSDFLLGNTLIHDEGKIILALIFLPVLAQFSMVIIKRCSKKSHKNLKLTLMGIDWLNLDDDKYQTTIVTIVLITMRIHIIRVYILLIKAVVSKDKKQKKKLDTRMRAEMFMETCFESLPQCCVQLYLFGTYSTVSHLQVVSFTMSTFTLVYSFALAHVEREAEIFHHTDKKSKLGICIEPCYHSDDDIDEEGIVLTKQNKQKAMIKLTKNKQSLNLRLLDLGSPPPKKLSMSFDLHFQKEPCNYDVTNALIQSKQLSINIEKHFFFWIRVINISIESPVFFLTAFPTIALFSCLFGNKFLLFYIPVAIHFVAEYWWWRPNVYKFVMNGSFHTIFLAFKLLERIMILGMICIWFIKVLNYSKPINPSHPYHLPSLVWPEQNTFLLAVSKYEKDEKSNKWGDDCARLRNPVDSSSTKKANGLNLPKVFGKFTNKNICAIEAATVIMCVVFYMNVVGMIWEVINYVVFRIFKWYTKYEIWKESHHIKDDTANSIFGNIFESICSNKYQVAKDLEDLDFEEDLDFDITINQ